MIPIRAAHSLVVVNHWYQATYDDMTVPTIRIGEGHDTHRLIEGRSLVLGGVEVDFEFGLDGHNDADVLLHAITDAILGAAGIGDIGEWFPNTDDKFADADSARLLRTVIQGINDRGWFVGNLDCTVFAERPKLSAYKDAMQIRIAEILNVDPGNVNVKAKSGEAVGPVGRQEAMRASAVALIYKGSSDDESA